MLVRVTTCNTVLEANWIKTYLESEGVQTYLINENFTTLMPVYNGMLGAGIQVLVDEESSEKALNLIFPEPLKIDGKLICPNCNFTSVSFGLGKRKVKKLFLVFLSVLFGVAFNNINNVNYCKNCKTEF